MGLVDRAIQAHEESRMASEKSARQMAENRFSDTVRIAREWVTAKLGVAEGEIEVFRPIRNPGLLIDDGRSCLMLVDGIRFHVYLQNPASTPSLTLCRADIEADPWQPVTDKTRIVDPVSLGEVLSRHPECLPAPRLA